MYKLNNSFIGLQLYNLTRKYQLFVLFGVVVGVLVLSNITFSYVADWLDLVPELKARVDISKLSEDAKNAVEKDIKDEEIQSITQEAAPEIWLSLLGLVLGTLIIVISIASQSTPKLIDLYIQDRTSILFVWFLVVGQIHILYLRYFAHYAYGNREMYHFIKKSVFLNTYILLPLALAMSIPYVLYILRYTKTRNVIEKIYQGNLERIALIQLHSKLGSFSNSKLVQLFQYEMFEALNQLDDLLTYVTFKEPKGDILHKISLSIQTYISSKKNFAEEFFKISPKIRGDISFKTMTNQFEEMERTRTFYEQKGFRMLGNAYLNLIEANYFDLASLCVSELASCGKAAIDAEDYPLVSAVLVRFNTFLRFGIKHGLRHGEARNLYNSIFHYSDFLTYVVRTKNQEIIRNGCKYLNIYVREIYRHSQQKEPSFIFLVDVFTWEMKKILIQLESDGLPLEFQEEMLGLFMQIDNLSDGDLSQAKKYNDGVRMLQVALSLYYIRKKQYSLAKVIIEDIANDAKYMGEKAIRNAVEATCHRLRISSPTFWEDTDRGNSNLYFSPDKEYIPAFLDIFEKKLLEVTAEKNI
ncbi:MAG: hypothetical protein NZ551_10015 [Microscillaceae bacterium]|nr:hypothetical protein [Microscillaceae bacterium]MDW8461531.1 hypothetical protein [Cytophagales bacterium]